MKLYSLLLSLLLLSCSSNKAESSTEQISTNQILEDKVAQLHQKINEWPESNERMNVIQKLSSEISNELELLIIAIEGKNNSALEISKKQLEQLISEFLFLNQVVDPTKNDDFFWIFENCKNDIINLNVDNENMNQVLNDLKNIEFSIISTLYMMGYTDQYAFNKMEPIANQWNFKMNPDSTAITVGFYCYDSTQCSKIKYTITTDKYQIQDSTNCNWIFVPNNIGKIQLEGSLEYQMFGKQFKTKFNDEIVVE